MPSQLKLGMAGKAKTLRINSAHGSQLPRQPWPTTTKLTQRFRNKCWRGELMTKPRKTEPMELTALMIGFWHVSDLPCNHYRNVILLRAVSSTNTDIHNSFGAKLDDYDKMWHIPPRVNFATCICRWMDRGRSECVQTMSSNRLVGEPPPLG